MVKWVFAVRVGFCSVWCPAVLRVKARHGEGHIGHLGAGRPSNTPRLLGRGLSAHFDKFPVNYRPPIDPIKTRHCPAHNEV